MTKMLVNSICGEGSSWLVEATFLLNLRSLPCAHMMGQGGRVEREMVSQEAWLGFPTKVKAPVQGWHLPPALWVTES